jgi:hypothetical protein
MKSLEKVFGDLPGAQMIVGIDNVAKLRKRPRAIAQLVREPQARLVSMYEYFTGTLQHPMPDMTDEAVEEWYDEVWGSLEPTFDEFVLGLPKVKDNHHFRCQRHEHEDLADVRWRLDDVDNLWRVLKVKVAPGLPPKFPHRNKTEHRKTVDEYMGSLSEEALAVYQDLYGDDEQFYKDALHMM